METIQSWSTCTFLSWKVFLTFLRAHLLPKSVVFGQMLPKKTKLTKPHQKSIKTWNFRARKISEIIWSFFLPFHFTSGED